MNASALLTAQGWRGKGHSLHKTDDAVGLAKPLLLNRKDNTKGIGATQHFTSDQWWMNAFDEQLQGLDTSKKGKVVQTITTGKLNAIEKGSLGKYSLYATFVRGGFLQGTIEALNKQKDDMDESTTDSDFETAEKKTKKNAPPKESKEESKEERRARKEAKRKRREEKDQRKLARELKKSKSKSDSSDDAAEEKRRRRARKEEKRRLRKEEAGQ